MSPFLLDVNVLIALIDSAHVQHDRAHAWFARSGAVAWATCPLTENGVVRILGNPRYANSPGTPFAVAELMKEFQALRGHVFWPDSISLFHEGHFDLDRLLESAQVTDSYLLVLAGVNGGRLATFDRRLIPNAVRDGSRSLYVID